MYIIIILILIIILLRLRNHAGVKFINQDISNYPDIVLKKIKKCNGNVTIYFTDEYVIKIQSSKYKNIELKKYDKIRRKIENDNYNGALIPKIYNNVINTDFLSEKEENNMIIYEKVGDINLKEWIKEIGNLSYIDKLNLSNSKKYIYRQVYKFVCTIHSNYSNSHTFHNDLHYENVMLTTDDRDISIVNKVYIIDFGYAKHTIISHGINQFVYFKYIHDIIYLYKIKFRLMLM